MKASFPLLGARVRIKSEHQILETLDRTGSLDGLPFMQEMRQYCGEVFTALKQVNRMMIEGSGVRSIGDAFILNARCDGSAHGGCDRLCAILWKPEWLEPPEEMRSDEGEKEPSLDSFDLCQGQASSLLRGARRTSLLDPRQYIHDIESGTYSCQEVLSLFSSTATSPVIWKVRQTKWTLTHRTPASKRQPSSLKPGDLVEVRSRQQIAETLDGKKKLQGLQFGEPMWRYCNKRFRVLKAVKRIIVEPTGDLRSLTDTYLLSDVICDGRPFRGCPRMCYWFWKGAWLKKICEPDDTAPYKEP